MPKMPGVNHQDAVRALQKLGFRIVRQKKHIIMSNGTQTLIIPRHTQSTHTRWQTSCGTPV
jgi:predicted RNA binding protein YcfA (HicA-like mRNA interferase family)